MSGSLSIDSDCLDLRTMLSKNAALLRWLLAAYLSITVAWSLETYQICALCSSRSSLKFSSMTQFYPMFSKPGSFRTDSMHTGIMSHDLFNPILLRPWSIRSQSVRDKMPLPVPTPTLTPSPIPSPHSYPHSYLEGNQEAYFQRVGYPEYIPPSNFPSPSASINKLGPHLNEQVRRTDIRCLRRSAQQFIVCAVQLIDSQTKMPVFRA